MVGENEAIDIPADSSVGVLLFHGLFSTPNELHVLGGILAANGYRVRIPLLPGRGDRWDDLHRLSWDDVRAAALRDLDLLAREHEQVVVGGMSAGATLALDVALERRAAALLLYAPALVVRRRIARLAPYLWRVVREFPFRVEGPVPHDRVPVRAVAELLHGIGHVRPRLGEITAPALVLHAREDPLIDVSSAEEVARALGGPVELVVVEGPTHAVTFGDQGDRVADLSVRFLRERVPARPRAERASTTPD